MDGPGRVDRKDQAITATVERAAATSARSEFAAAWADVAALVRAGAAAVRRPRTLSWRWVVLVAWTVGVVGDAYTTLAMMATGVFEEGNPVAAAGMGAIGPVGYVAAASLVSAAMAVVSCGAPRGLYSKVVLAVLWFAGAWKVWTATSNALLWAGVLG